MNIEAFNNLELKVPGFPEEKRFNPVLYLIKNQASQTLDSGIKNKLVNMQKVKNKDLSLVHF